MKFQEFQKIVEKYPFFTTNELRLILRKNFNKTLKIQLKQWTHSQYLIKLRRSVYLLNRKDIIGDLDLAYLALKIYSPSYVSLEYALSYYGVIPEAVSVITSVTTRKTSDFKNSLGNFTYHHIKPESFLGFEQKKYNFFTYQIATKEKALVDYFYLNQNKFTLDNKFWNSMRFNLEKNFNLKKLNYYCRMFNNKKLDKIISGFIKYVRS